ncbi:nucleophile aminohydrolase [Tricharina praecox]|uniref:nucleophile aminohydrolase n=1 Tax=Tricharina praecox TaxID=43433 RepID=UPI0022207073|nr:nucleophile aminohydrolase [Tricharina praecox]KAI5849999.1 nucleophile aminohydrolase [Tricharina praecox]
MSLFASPSYAPSAHAASGPQQHAFNPYTNNGGSIIGIAGDDFLVMAGDTRHTSGYSINSRTEKKVFRLGEDSNLVLATVGFGADAKNIAETMTRAVDDFRFQHNLRNMSVTAAAQFLFTVLYGNRFFPKYAHCILGGLDKDGKAKLYSYDPVGSYSKEGERRAAAGAASSLIVPFLDNQVEFKNQYVPGTAFTQERPVEYLSREKVKMLVKDAFTSATERHIEVGDGLQLVTISKDGYHEEVFDLKRD